MDNLPFDPEAMVDVKPVILIVRDDAEPEEVEFDAMNMDICPEGHIHAIIIGDTKATLETYQHLTGGGATSNPVVIASSDKGQALAAQAIAGLTGANKAIDIKDALLDLMEQVGEGLPAIFNEHTEKLRETMAYALATGDHEPFERESGKFYLDPRYLNSVREQDGREPFGGRFAGFDTIAEAALERNDPSLVDPIFWDKLTNDPEWIDGLLDEIEEESK